MPKLPHRRRWAGRPLAPPHCHGWGCKAQACHAANWMPRTAPPPTKPRPWPSPGASLPSPAVASPCFPPPMAACEYSNPLCAPHSPVRCQSGLTVVGNLPCCQAEGAVIGRSGGRPRAGRLGEMVSGLVLDGKLTTQGGGPLFAGQEPPLPKGRRVLPTGLRSKGGQN